MSTRASFFLIFSAGVAILGFAQVYLFRKAFRLIRKVIRHPRLQQALIGFTCVLLVLMFLPYLFRLFYKWPEHEVSAFVLYGMLYPLSIWSLGSVSSCILIGLKDMSAIVLHACRRWRGQKHPESTSPSQVTRRDFLRWTFGAAALSPLGALTYGAAIGKEWHEIVEHTLVLPNLSPALQGLRLVQLTDIHVGNFLKQERLEEYVRVVNELGPDLVALTGDFIGSSPQFIRPCAKALGKLRAKQGVFACLGNHDHWVGAHTMTSALEAAGVEVLRNEGRRLLIRDVPLNVAGVDDPWRGTADFDQALADLHPAAPTVLLCHQPDLFPAAARRGVALTLSGHYHGGQIKLPLPGFSLSPAHLISRFVEGLYRSGRSQLYVSRGIGVTGPPIRLNARPEITLLHLT
ncbi:MAG: metallophosphoesterase [Candidatus Entotheonellia bacterium]